MKVLLSWLKEFVDFDLSPHALADGLTLQGTEAESVRLFADFFTPDTFICEVASVGSALDETFAEYEIYADGRSVKAASRVRHIPPGFRVLAKRISSNDAAAAGGFPAGYNAFIPTLAELGLNQLRFPLVIPSTMTVDDVRNDAMIEFDTLSNRGDLLSHLGIAREVSILTGSPWLEPEIFDEYGTTDEKSARPIRLDAPDLCPRYIGMSFDNVVIADSPDWMWYRLCAIGLNPISNLVDTTNYVLMELGQPLHAFDSDKLDGGIIVRRAAAGEKFAAINHNVYDLTTNHLMIADQSKAVAIGGVMGGLESEIADDTKSLFLESAYFAPVHIRKTSKRLGLMSDSALRFGRGVDPTGTARGALRFAKLLLDCGGGSYVRGSFRDANEIRGEKRVIGFPVERVRSLLGITLKDEQIQAHLESAGFSIAGRPPVVQAMPPAWRSDFEIPEDVVEEVLRLYSYTRVKPEMPTLPLGLGGFEETFRFEARVREALRAMALQEVRTYTLVNPSVVRRWLNRPSPAEGKGYDGVLPEIVFLANPDTAEMSAMRLTTGAGLVEVYTLNTRKHSEAIPVIYEVGRIYMKAAPGEHYAYAHERDGVHFSETRTVGIIVSEAMAIPAFAGVSFAGVSPLYTAKSIVSRLLSEFGCDAAYADAGDDASSWFERGRALSVTAGGVFVGEIGLLRTELDPLEGARGRIAFAELSIDAMRALPKPDRSVESPSQYPAILRDIALIVPLTLAAGELAATIRELGGGMLADVSAFDQYTGKNLAPRELAGKLTPVKNLAFKLLFQSGERTLTGDEIDRAVFDILAGCHAKYGAVLRDYEQVKSDSIFGDAALWGKLMEKYGK